MKQSTKKVLTTLLTLTMGTAVHAQKSWKMQPIVLQTRWAKDVNPNHTLEEYPRPQMKRANWTNLNGLWTYAITEKDAPEPLKYSGNILVPYPIESALSGVKKALQPNENLWYRRTFTAAPNKKRTLLHFGAVDWQASVFINGKEVGNHTGGYTAFSIDITDKLQPGENEIAVKVFDPSDFGIGPHGKQVLSPQNIYYTATSGIWQTVWLETVPQIYVTNINTTPDIDKRTLSLNVQLNDPKANIEIEATASENGKKIAVWHSRHSDGKLAIPKAHLWSPEDPFLYDLKIRIKHKGKIIDEVKSYFGMRKISIAKDEKGFDRIALNNKPYYNLGTLDQGFWPEGLYTAPTDEALTFDINAIKAMGFNTIRKHIKVEPAKWYYDADKIGMLVWQDMVDPNQSLPEGSKLEFEKESKEILDQLHNYPSITTWVVFNEEWGAYDQKRLTQWVKDTDPSRIVNGHSGGYLYINDQNVKGADSVYVNSDITDIHSYTNPMQSKRETGKAQVCGEFGGVGVSVAGHQWNDLHGWGYVQATPKELISKYTVMVKRLQRLKDEGLSGSIYTQPFDVEGEENGLMTYDREIIKMPLKTIRQINSQLVNQNNKGFALTKNQVIIKTIDAEDSDDKYPELIKQFEAGKTDSAFLRRLILMALRKEDQSKATSLEKVYIQNLHSPYTKNNLLFIASVSRTTEDSGFEMFLADSAKINHLFGRPFATDKIEQIVRQSTKAFTIEAIDDHNFNSVLQTFTAKYGEVGERIVLVNIAFYYYQLAFSKRIKPQDYTKPITGFVRYKNKIHEKYPDATSIFDINNDAWLVFENSDNLDDLNSALLWQKKAISDKWGSNHAESIDTYANILYKMGRTEEAIKFEEKAVVMSNNGSVYVKILDKMKKGEPTWPIPEREAKKP